VVASHWQSTDKGTLCTQTCQLLGPPELNTGFAWICHSSPGATLCQCQWICLHVGGRCNFLPHCFRCSEICTTHQKLFTITVCKNWAVQNPDSQCLFVCFFSSQWNCTSSRIAILVLTRSMKSEGPLDITRSVLHQKWNILHDGRVKVYWIDSNCVPGPNWQLAAEHVHIYNRVCSPATIHTQYHLFTNAMKCRYPTYMACQNVSLMGEGITHPLFVAVDEVYLGPILSCSVFANGGAEIWHPYLLSSFCKNLFSFTV
jgi:hypothetical protein